jgi:hypothetical protein
MDARLEHDLEVALDRVAFAKELGIHPDACSSSLTTPCAPSRT